MDGCHPLCNSVACHEESRFLFVFPYEVCEIFVWNPIFFVRAGREGTGSIGPNAEAVEK
jgi:hypothetical protein